MRTRRVKSYVCCDGAKQKEAYNGSAYFVGRLGEGVNLTRSLLFFQLALYSQQIWNENTLAQDLKISRQISFVLQFVKTKDFL